MKRYSVTKQNRGLYEQLFNKFGKESLLTRAKMGVKEVYGVVVDLLLVVIGLLGIAISCVLYLAFSPVTITSIFAANLLANRFYIDEDKQCLGPWYMKALLFLSRTGRLR